MAQKKSECPHCGSKVVEYKHGMNRVLLVGLAAAARRDCGKGFPVDLKLLELPRSEWDNFSKLRYWELVRRDGNAKKGGKWVVTAKGYGFLAGNVSVAKHVWTFRGETRRYEGKEVFIWNIKDGPKFRVDYATEARSILAAPDPDQLELL